MIGALAYFLQAAESGHLVFSTMHTIDAAETLGRLTEFFPAVKQQMIRSILAGVLRGVISQRLIPKVGGGRVAAVELMVNNARIADLIRDARPDEIHDAIHLIRPRRRIHSDHAAVRIAGQERVNRVSESPFLSYFLE